MKKRYLIIGNAENTHMLKWVKALIRHYDLYVISSMKTHRAIHELLPEGRIFDLDLGIADEGGNYQLVFEYFKVKKIIREIDPAIVNPHYITSHGFLAALIKRLGRFRFILVQSAWGTDILVTPFKNSFYRWVTKFSLKAADWATSDSRHMTGIMTGLYPVNTLTFSFGLDELPDYDPHEKDFHLFYSNRMLSPNYNIGEVIRFFSRIAADDPEARLIVAHDGPERQSLETLAEDLGLARCVTFRGFISEEEQAENYRRAGFYISIPTSDATSVSLLEAMAYGCIPVVSDIPANREWITEGINGIYYRAENTGRSSLVGALADREGIAGRNREIIREHAIFPDAIEKYVEQLNSLGQ